MDPDTELGIGSQRELEISGNNIQKVIDIETLKKTKPRYPEKNSIFINFAM